MCDKSLIYLRNKETQQTLWGIVDWLCNASVSCIRFYYMKAVSKRQNTAGWVTISVTYVLWRAHNHTDPPRHTLEN